MADKDIQEKLDWLDSLSEEEGTPTKKEKKGNEEVVGKPLKYFPDGVAAMPQELTRAAIFCLLPNNYKDKDITLNDFVVESRDDEKMLFSGVRLRIKDETVWLACLRVARGIPVGQRIYLTKAHFLAECGLVDSGPNWGNVEASLLRLSKAHIQLVRKEARITIHLLAFGVEDETGRIYFRLYDEGRRIFEELAYQPWEVRLALKHDIDKRLLSYVSGHKQGARHKAPLKGLKDWCGYTGRIDKFANKITSALNTLEDEGVIKAGTGEVFKEHGEYYARWKSIKVERCES